MSTLLSISVGQPVSAELPNITGGSHINATESYPPTGAFYKLSSATCVVGEAGTNPILGFNASRCSSIYKDSATTVVPESLITNFYIRY